MADRRSLIEGLKTNSSVDPAIEKEFVLGGKAKPAADQTAGAASPADRREGKGQTANAVSRVPLTTRVRADFAKALKRASLERQLSGQYPNTMLDILEEALEPWLRSHGYLS